MSRRLIGVGLLAGMALAPAAAGAEEKRTINVAVQRESGEKTRGPATLTLTTVNVLRYDVLVGVSVTFSGAPDLQVPFIPPIAAVAGGRISDAEKGSRAADTLPGLRDSLGRLESDRLKRVQGPISELIESTNAARRKLDALVAGSDGALRTPKGASQLVAASDAMSSTIGAAIGRTWPSAEILAQLERVMLLRNQLPGLTPSKPEDKLLRDYIAARLDTLETWYGTVGANSESARTALDAQGKLAGWKPILDSIAESKEAAFTLPPVRVGCGFAFGGTKESKVELIKRDRTAPAGTAEAREEILTVVCSSPMSVSGGFGRSSVDDPVFALVSSSKTTTTGGTTTTTAISRFGLTESSGYTVLPVLLVNTRVWEPNDSVSVHLSAGAAVDASGAAGTDVDYLVGPSIAFKREVFITVGWHFGRIPSLAGGFALDDEVPQGVGAPPLRKARATGALVAVSFKLR